MMRFLLLLIIAALTFGIIYLATRPDVFDQLWLYLVGLAAVIIKFFQVLWKKIKSFGKEVNQLLEKPAEKPPSIIQAQNENDPVG